jgi:hypothetical protein
MSRAFGAGLKRRKPPVMPVVHGIGLGLPEGDGIGALLLIQIDFVGGSIQAPVGVVTCITPFCEYMSWYRKWVCSAFSLREGQ